MRLKVFGSLLVVLAVGACQVGTSSPRPPAASPGGTSTAGTGPSDGAAGSPGPVLPGGRFAFAYPFFPLDGTSGVAAPEGFVERFAGGKHNPGVIEGWASSGRDIRALNPQGMYFKHVNLRITDNTRRGAGGSKIDGLPDYDWIHANHPEWIIKDRRGEPVPLYLPTEEVLDFGNDAYLDWALNTWMPQQLFDETDLAAPVIYLQHDNGDFQAHDIDCAPGDAVCARYTTDEGMQSAWVHMLTRVKQRWPQVRIIVSSGPKPFVEPTVQLAALKRVLAASDGYYSEGLTDRHHNYLRTATGPEKRVALEMILELAAWLSDQGKVFMPIEGQDDGIPPTQADTDYAFAFFNLLRTTSDRQFFGQINIDPDGQWAPTEYPEMDAPLGAPTGPATQVRPHVYQRTFDEAVAYVNLSDTTTTIDLPTNAVTNSRGRTVTTLTLEPFSGITLYG